MAKYIDKITVPIKENGSTTTTTLHLVDGTLASWVRESSKPLYDASEIEYSTTASSGPLLNAQRVDEALDDTNSTLISLGSSIANLEITQPYVLTYGASVNTAELGSIGYGTKRPIVLKVLSGDMRSYDLNYVYDVTIEGNADQGDESIGYLEFEAANGYNYYYNITAGTWTSAAPTGTAAVTNTLDVSKKYYITGTSVSATNTGTQFFDNNIYATTTAGQLNATTYKVNEQVTLQWNSTDSCLDFIFA